MKVLKLAKGNAPPHSLTKDNGTEKMGAPGEDTELNTAATISCHHLPEASCSLSPLRRSSLDSGAKKRKKALVSQVEMATSIPA